VNEAAPVSLVTLTRKHLALPEEQGTGNAMKFAVQFRALTFKDKQDLHRWFTEAGFACIPPVEKIEKLTT